MEGARARTHVHRFSAPGEGGSGIGIPSSLSGAHLSSQLSPSQLSCIPVAGKIAQQTEDSGGKKDAPGGKLEGKGRDGHLYSCPRWRGWMDVEWDMQEGGSQGGRVGTAKDPDPQRGRPRKGWAPYFCRLQTTPALGAWVSPAALPQQREGPSAPPT